MSTFHLTNFGCRASQADGAAIKRQLLEAGLEEQPTPHDCDVAVLNTCTVTASADAEVRQVIRRIHRSNPQCKILVTGCYAQRAPEEIAKLEGVAWVVGNSHKHTVAQLVSLGTGPALPEPVGTAQRNPARSLPLRLPTVAVGEISDEFHFAPVFADDRTRPTLKVQDGCSARCSFCTIPAVRGKSRSLAPDRVVDQIRRLEDEGYKEVVLSGINLGSYGRDCDRSLTFLGLLERILAGTTIPRLRISSIEPMDVSPALIRLVASEPRMARHLHIPLQSGADRILRMMNRRYWTTQYAERILGAREAMPDAALGADVMVGFPGETDDDHETSRRFIESLPLTYLHVFPYSARPGTPAAARADQVNGRIAHNRGLDLRRLSAAKHQAFLASQIGRVLSVLTLDEECQGGTLALSSNYLKVRVAEPGIEPNTLLDIHVSRAREGLLDGYSPGNSSHEM